MQWLPTKFRALNLPPAKPISHYKKKYNPLKLLSVSYKQSTIRSATVFEHSTLILYKAVKNEISRAVRVLVEQTC